MVPPKKEDKKPPEKDKDKKKGFMAWLPEFKPWTREQAQTKEQELKDMWETYGEYADTWLQRKTNDPDLQIWDFTDKEMRAIMKWCLKRGQSNAAIAVALDAAMEGRTDIDFAVIILGKTMETGYRLSKAGMRR